MKFLSFLLICFMLGLSACTPRNRGDSASAPVDWFSLHQNDASRFAEIFPVPVDNRFIFATYEQVLTQLRYGTGVVVFGFPACPRCHNAFPVLEKAFRAMNMDRYVGLRGRILYYDIFNDREANNERYQTIVSYLKDFLRTDANGNPRIFVPDVYFLASGKIVGNHLDTVQSLTNPRDPLNEEQEAELFKIYRDLIEEAENCEC